MFCSEMSEEAPTLCWPQIRVGPLILFMVLYVIQSNFFQYGHWLVIFFLVKVGFLLKRKERHALWWLEKYIYFHPWLHNYELHIFILEETMYHWVHCIYTFMFHTCHIVICQIFCFATLLPSNPKEFSDTPGILRGNIP